MNTTLRIGLLLGALVGTRAPALANPSWTPPSKMSFWGVNHLDDNVAAVRVHRLKGNQFSMTIRTGATVGPSIRMNAVFRNNEIVGEHQQTWGQGGNSAKIRVVQRNGKPMAILDYYLESKERDYHFPAMRIFDPMPNYPR